MEGNVMGMLFAPVLLVSAIAYAVLGWDNFAGALEEPVGRVMGYRIHEDEIDDGCNSTNGGASRASELPAVS
jgi:predicted membrane chloride channel (bestrophin family)